MQKSHDRSEKNWILGVTSLASFMMALDSLIITTAFAAIRTDLASPVATLQWAINAFNLAFAVLLLTGAALGDRFGRRLVFAVGIALFVASSAGCALSASAGSLIASRAAQGAGAALVTLLAMAILSAAFPKEQRARALGIFSGATGCALIVGPAIGGLITASWGWRWIFWINLPIGLLVALVDGAMFGIAVLLAAFAVNGTTDSAADFSHGFAAAMRVAAALSLLAACAGLWLPAPRSAASAPGPQSA
jgi:MFS family permease